MEGWSLEVSVYYDVIKVCPTLSVTVLYKMSVYSTITEMLYCCDKVIIVVTRLLFSFT